MIKRIRRVGTTVRYEVERPLTWQHSVILVWAGMRGAVILAAVHALPEGTPQRSLLIFIAFLGALLSRVIQGSTLSAVVRWVKPEGEDPELVQKEAEALLDAREIGSFSSEALSHELERLDAFEISYNLSSPDR